MHEASFDAPGHSNVEAPPDEPREGELARFFGYSHDVLAILDGEGRLVRISPSVERVLGYGVAELAGRAILDLVHPEDGALVRQEAEMLLEGRTIGDLDFRMEAADGSWVPMRWSLAVGRDGRLYGVGRDHTDQVRHRAALLRNEIAELRLRTARELHDGILQTLTAAGLRIAVARKLVHGDPDAAEKVLESLGATVAAEQQEMRLYVDELKGRDPVWTDAARSLPERITALLSRVSSIWGVEVTVDARGAEGVGGELGRQVLRIAQEATVNAARHGAAESVSVRLVREDSDLLVVVSDRGAGFSFRGDFEHEELWEKRLGPLSLKHRVAEAGGRISIRSTQEGATVSVRLPLPTGARQP